VCSVHTEIRCGDFWCTRARRVLLPRGGLRDRKRMWYVSDLHHPLGIVLQTSYLSTLLKTKMWHDQVIWSV
jgi:hypothetical protein